MATVLLALLSLAILLVSFLVSFLTSRVLAQAIILVLLKFARRRSFLLFNMLTLSFGSPTSSTVPYTSSCNHGDLQLTWGDPQGPSGFALHEDDVSNVLSGMCNHDTPANSHFEACCWSANHG